MEKCGKQEYTEKDAYTHTQTLDRDEKDIRDREKGIFTYAETHSNTNRERQR